MSEQHGSTVTVCRRLSEDSVNVATGQRRGTAASLRKSYSCVDTMRDSQVMQQEGLLKKKYKKRFEKIFRPVVGQDTLFTCYSCSLYQEGMATGHLYLTLGWFCFYSNFMGRQRQVTIDVNSIQSITQQRTAKIIPNAIRITTETQSYFFSSFISRDRAYRTLLNVWRKAEEPRLSCEDSDLSDVESMTRIATFPGYNDVRTTKSRSFEDSTSETSLPGAETEDAGANQDGSSGIIDFTASVDIEETQEVTEVEEATPNSPEEVPVSSVNNLQCTQWKFWHRAERSLMCIQSLMQWCGSQVSEMLGDHYTFYTLLIVCTAVLAMMTFYLGLRMFIFEKEQMEYMLHRRVQLHESDIQYRMETNLELNHRLLSQVTEILSTIHKLLLDNSFRCCP